MYINITKLIHEIAPMDYSASVVEIGANAGRATWEAACNDALELFGEQFDREAFDAYFSGFGAWSKEELAAHSDRESAALMLQSISGDIGECEFSDWPERFTPAWWTEYENAASDGIVSARMGRGDDGSIYYYIGE